jgi:colicin import membrane protein
VTKGEKTAKEVKPAPRVDRVADKTDLPPEPPLNAANKDVPAPPPQAPRRPEPGADNTAEPPTPPKRVAAPPPAAEPPPPEKKVAKPPEPAPKPPARDKAAVEEDKPEPEEAEVVKPKPPKRPKIDKAEDKPEETPPKPRLRADDIVKLLEKRKEAEKPKENPDAETADKAAEDSKPKSGDETAPKSKFDLASIANLLSREAPQRRAATGQEVRPASLGAAEGAAEKLSASMESRIAAYIHDHYHPCWVSALSLGGATYAPVVEFHLSRTGELEGRPKLVNGSNNPVEHARGEQALQAVRRCSPMKIPPDFMPYYDEVLRDITIRFRDEH